VAAKAKKAKEDLAKLQGAWVVADLEIEGRPMPAGDASIVIAGSAFTTIAMGAEYEGTIEVNSAAAPAQFDLHFTSGPERGNTSLGIYELNGDVWRICLTLRGGVRPTRFETTPGSGLALERLEREADASDSAEESSARPSLEQAPELEGEWEMVSCDAEGYSLPAQFLKGGRRVARHNEVTVMLGGQTLVKAALFTVDRSKNPMTIDYFLRGRGKARIQQGIYSLDGKSLKTSFAPPGKDRPTDFQPGQGRTVTVWQLVSPK